MECPCCRSWCDTVRHVDGDVETCACFADGCAYDEPIDAAGYATLDAAARRLRAVVGGRGTLAYTVVPNGVVASVGESRSSP